MEEQRNCPRCGYVFEPFEEGACPRCQHLAETHLADPRHAAVPEKATEEQRTCPRCGYVFEPFEEGACPRCQHLAELHLDEPRQPEEPDTEVLIPPPPLPAELPQSHPLPSDAEAVASMRAADDRQMTGWSEGSLIRVEQGRVKGPIFYLFGMLVTLIIGGGFCYAALDPTTRWSTHRGAPGEIATAPERLVMWCVVVVLGIAAVVFFTKFLHGDD